MIYYWEAKKINYKILIIFLKIVFFMIIYDAIWLLINYIVQYV
jgi:hypothetical protein